MGPDITVCFTGVAAVSFLLNVNLYLTRVKKEKIEKTYFKTTPKSACFSRIVNLNDLFHSSVPETLVLKIGLQVSSAAQGFDHMGSYLSSIQNSLYSLIQMML